jgi:thiamine pyrophosphate-dependent acetolactate synthase large subunit-like protein
MSNFSVAKSALHVFSNAGVSMAFGLPGVHNLAFWREESSDTPRIVGVRHEQTAMYAADGLARATGGLGVALTTTGPGAANAVGAFGEAAASGSPVVLIASEISTALSTRGLVRGVLHESADQAALFAPLAKAVFTPRTPDSAVAAVAEAAQVAMNWPRGPVYVDIPTDILSEPSPPMPTRPAERLRPARQDVDAAAELIGQADRIVIWVGGGVVQSEAGQELASLAEKLQAPIVTTFAARGILPSAHACMVNLPPHERAVAQLIGDSDLLIAIGTDFDGMTTRNWTMPVPALLVNINCDQTDLTKNYEPDISILADAKLAIEALVGACNKTPFPLPPIKRLESDVWASLRSDDRSSLPCQFIDGINEATRQHDAIVIADMAIPGYWVGGYGRFDLPRRLQYPVGWGTLGYALPASVGVGALNANPVLVVCGDGGFMFAVGELAVLAEMNSPVTILIVDDGGYGMLRYDQDHAGDARRGVDFGGPDFVRLGQAFGIESTQINGFGEPFCDVLNEALESRRPRLIVCKEALTPPRTTSPRWNE